MQSFLEQYPVFTLDELKSFFGEKARGKSAYNLLLHDRMMGRVGMVKQGVTIELEPIKLPIQHLSIRIVLLPGCPGTTCSYREKPGELWNPRN